MIFRKNLILIAFCFNVIVAGLFFVANASAQCTTPPGATQEDTWAQGAQVQVNIDPTYNTEQRTALAQALTNWNNARLLNCSGVVFGIPTYNATPIAGPTISVGSLTSYKFQVYKLDPPDGSGDRGLTAGKVYPGHYTVTSWSYLNTNVSDPSALTQLLAHEIGHTFGLLECNFCGATQSIVNGPAPSYNDTNGLTSPTTCDNVKVKEVGMYICSITYTRAPGIGPGSFPVFLNPQTGAMTTVTHAMSISNYNASTGSFTLRFTDYTTSRPNYQSSVTNSGASPDPYTVVKNTDPCFNANGSVKDLTFTNGPVFGCSFSQQISLTQTGTENYAPPNGGNSGSFVKVYTGTTTPGSGIPYMHFLHSNTNGTVAYAYNGVIPN